MTNYNDPPVKPDEGFIYEDVASGEASPARPQAFAARTRATQLTKSALEYYLKQYFSPDGIYREQISDLAPYVVQFETGISGSAHRDDPLVYEMQIARYFSGTKAKLPCILIVDTSYTQNSTGLGGIVGGYDLGTHVGISLRMDVTISLQLEVMANDESTASDLRDVLSLIFGSLTHLNRAHVLKPESAAASWEVRLPLRYDVQGLERRQFPNDNLDVYWSSSLTLACDFEGVALIGRHSPNEIFRNEKGVEVPTEACSSLNQQLSISVIQVPSQLYLTQNKQIFAPVVPFQSKFVSDNPNILRVFGETLVPRRPGSCNVLLLDPGGNTLKVYPVTISV